MATLRQDGDKIRLSLTDIRILSALMVGRMNGYQLRLQCLQDGRGEHDELTASMVQQAIKSLDQLGLIQEILAGKPSARGERIYQISSLGQILLDHYLQDLRRLTRLGLERFKR
jgi:DNA-binding PadR family transcriptional regulator